MYEYTSKFGKQTMGTLFRKGRILFILFRDFLYFFPSGTMYFYKVFAVSGPYRTKDTKPVGQMTKIPKLSAVLGGCVP